MLPNCVVADRPSFSIFPGPSLATRPPQIFPMETIIVPVAAAGYVIIATESCFPVFRSNWKVNFARSPSPPAQKFNYIRPRRNFQTADRENTSRFPSVSYKCPVPPKLPIFARDLLFVFNFTIRVRDTQTDFTTARVPVTHIVSAL